MTAVEYQHFPLPQESLVPNGARKEEIHMETLESGEEAQIDTSKSIYAPEDIGLSSREGDHGDRKVSNPVPK